MNIDRTKLAKVCGMLSSSFEGERAVAAERATSMLRAAGLTWDDIVQRAFETPAKPKPEPKPKPKSKWNEDDEDPIAKYGPGKSWHFDGYSVTNVVLDILSYTDDLTDWEFEFVTSINEQLDRSLKGCSPKQWVVLKRIARKKGVI